MITRADIIHFYEKYKKNLKIEEQLTKELARASGQEDWVERLKQRHRVMRQLYIENEALLNLYVRPVLEGRTELTEETALEYVAQIRQAWREGCGDNTSMLEMAEALEPFLLEHGLMDAYIWDLSLLGILYNNCMEKEEGEKGYAYFKKICDLSDHYFKTEDFEVRKRIIYAFYNRPILQVNFGLEDEETLSWNLEQGMHFFRDPKVLDLDGDRFDFEGLAQELNYDVYGNYVISHTRENSARWFLERGEKVLSGYYQRELAKDPNPYVMPDEIYCYYKRTAFFLGRISCTEFLRGYQAYCEYSLEHDTLDHSDGYWESRLFHVAVNHIPGILECLRLYGSEYVGPPIAQEDGVRAYADIVRRMPRGENYRFVSDAVQKSLDTLLELMEKDNVLFDILIDVMLNRDEITLIHSHMVGRISELLLSGILEKKPELLIGTLGCGNVVEVLENREKIAAFVAHAAKLFDIGKLKDIDIANRQSRELTAQEEARIQQHPEAGAEMVRKNPSLNRFYDVILGHHKSWDGFMGYPKFFDNRASKDRFLIELIHISDSIDAATDFIGRSYKIPKTMDECLEELRQGRGTLYCPELVDLILDSPELRDRLERLLNQGRIHACYEVYSTSIQSQDDPEPENKVPVRSWAEVYGVELEEDRDEKEKLINVLHESSQANYNFVRAMVRHSLLTLYVNLRSGKYQVISRGEQRLFGSLLNGSYSEFLARQLQRIAFPEDWEKFSYQLNLSELIHTLAVRDGRFECEMRLLLGGAYRWTRLQFVQLDEENVIPKTMTMVITDVQERHTHGEQMEAALKDAYHTAMEASKTKSVFLSSMSHDVRTPMNGIMGMTQIALQHLDDRSRVEDCLKKIETSSEYLMRLLNEVLDMSRIESGTTVLNEQPVLLEKLLTEVIDLCRPDIQKARQELILELSVLSGVCVMADPVRLRQIFTNILSNAVKYTRDGGRIQVLAECLSEDPEKGNCYRFRIRDNGIGMSPEFQKQLFEPFAREDNSLTNARQGTGLGLSITKAMVTKMGGAIEAESIQGQGTTFTVTLRFLPAVRPEEEEAPEEALPRFDGRRILLVEDNELNREIACELLEEIGLTVETAADGVEAVDRFRKSLPGYYELILMDIQMPRMNGYEAAKTIRALPGEYARKIPIVALTANVLREDAMKALESGMNAHVGKPIDLHQVAQTLGKWLK